MGIAKNLLLSTAAAAALSAASGCGAQSNGEVPFYPGERPGEVTMYRDLQFEDIPVPAEYVLIRDRSHTFQGSRFRSGVLYYEGPLDASDAIAFFRRETPASGWSLENFNRDYNFVEMRFRKGPEQLIVVVRYLPYGSRAEMQLDNIEQNDLLLKGKLKSGQ